MAIILIHVLEKDASNLYSMIQKMLSWADKKNEMVMDLTDKLPKAYNMELVKEGRTPFFRMKPPENSKKKRIKQLNCFKT